MPLTELIAISALLIAIVLLLVVWTGQRKRKQYEAALEIKLLKLQQDLKTYNSAAAGIGSQVIEVSQKLLDTVDRVDEMQHASSSDSNYELARRLIEKGEALVDIEEQCQLSSAESRLLEMVRDSQPKN
jgi:cell division protein FtsX